MKIVRYWDVTANTAKYGVLETATIHEIAGSPYGDIRTTGSTVPVADTRLLAPCEPTKIVAGGANYHGHLKEVGLPVPETPVFFLKPPTTIIGPNEAVIYPPESKRVEYEGELAVVVKRTMRKVSPAQVLPNLLGYTCVNDVTARDIQVQGGNLLHLCHSKSFDTFCPTGPWLETELDTRALDVELRVNGVVKQHSNTNDTIFSVEAMVSYFSHVMTLLPGDLILMGSPPGIGEMHVGDTVELAIEGIGTLRHSVAAGP